VLNSETRAIDMGQRLRRRRYSARTMACPEGNLISNKSAKVELLQNMHRIGRGRLGLVTAALPSRGLFLKSYKQAELGS